MRHITHIVLSMLLLGSTALTGTAELFAQTGVPAGLPTDQIIVRYKAAATVSALDLAPGSVRLQTLIDAAGAPITFAHPMSGDALVLRLNTRISEEDAQRIADLIGALPEIDYAEPDRILQRTLTPNDTLFGSQWDMSGAYGMNMTNAWAITTGVASTIVAVIDTGYRPHADLSGRFIQGYDFVSDVLTANDGNGRDTDAQDPGDWITSADASGYFSGCYVDDSSWHGTHVAGTIGANGNNGSGVAGVNWKARLLPVRVLGKCGGYTSDIVDGMRWAAGIAVTGVPNNANPARAINISLGGTGACSTVEQSAINEINARGSIIVVAAGNGNADAAGFNPANCNGVISVGATDNAGARARYSNYGASVDVSAPGGAQSYANDPSGILSTLNAGATVPGIDNYVYYQGTSMATPHVVGLISLMAGISPTLNYTRAESLLKLTARPFGPGNDCATMQCGAGIIDARAALAALNIRKRHIFPLVFHNSGTAPNPVANGDFESGNTGWTVYSTHGRTIITNSGFAPRGGSWAAWLGGESSDISTIQQSVTVPAGRTHLSYWHWIVSSESGCGWDIASVRVNGVIVDSYGLCTSSNTGGWAQHIVDLTAYTGKTVTLQLRVDTDVTIISNLFLDDVTFQP